MSAIAASIELSPKQALTSPDLPGLFPAGTRVYLTDLGEDSDEALIAAANRLIGLGYKPVPHLAARRMGSIVALEARIRGLTARAGVRDMLVIGGGPGRPAGPFTSTMDVLETGILQRCGITDLAVAGHPEGSPDFSPEIAFAALRAKADFARRTGIHMRIVTQFGFDGPRFVAWAQEIRAQGIDLPVHFGVAGPAKITTLLKYAVACGVGNSLSFLRKRALNLTALARPQSPEDVVRPIEAHLAAHPDGNVAQIHIFAFGGVQGTAAWLRERGSWPLG